MKLKILIYKFKFKLSYVIKNKAGRNNSGKITFFSKGKKKKSNSYLLYCKSFGISRIICFMNEVNRSGSLALIQNFSGYIYFILATDKMHVNDLIYFSFLKHSLKKNFKKLKLIGDFLYKIPVGSLVCNIGFQKYSLSKIARAGGTSAKIVSNYNNITKLKLNSNNIIEISNKKKAYFGSIFLNKIYLNKKNAGSMHFFGIKSKVRGVAMNPCDHPHGGGEGRKSGKSAPRNPFGKIVRKKTRSNTKKKLIFNV